MHPLGGWALHSKYSKKVSVINALMFWTKRETFAGSICFIQVDFIFIPFRKMDEFTLSRCLIDQHTLYSGH